MEVDDLRNQCCNVPINKKYYSDNVDIIPNTRYTFLEREVYDILYMTVREASEKWRISDRRVRVLCSEGKIPGVIHEGRSGRYLQIQRSRKMVDGKLQRVFWKL